MSDILDFEIHDGENERQYIWRVGQYVESGKITWKELSKIINEKWRESEDLYRDESAYRKPFQNSKSYYEDVFSDIFNNGKTTQLSQVKDLIGEQYIVKKQIQNERNKLNKVKDGFVKSLSVAEEVIEAIREDGMNIVIPERCKTPIIDDSEKVMMLIISDWHIGLKINNCKGNSYNYEIANKRIDKLVEACKKYIQLYKISKIYVFNLGDTIEHTYMRKTQNDSNEFKLGKQIPKAIDLIFKLLTLLSELDCNVVYDSIAGNHDRSCGDKNQNYDGDNVNDTITPLLEMLVNTSENQRICIINRNYTDTEITTEINGVRFKLVHGDKNMKNDSLKNEISMDNCFYDVYITGHWHNYKCVSENRGRYIIYNGCLSGFNDYSTGFGCATEAEQTIVIVGQNEIEMVKDVNLA